MIIKKSTKKLVDKTEEYMMMNNISGDFVAHLIYRLFNPNFSLKFLMIYERSFSIPNIHLFYDLIVLGKISIYLEEARKTCGMQKM